MQKQLKTLIVDDDEVDRRTLRRLVPRTGLTCDIDEACDAETALARVAAGHYDLVFLDHRLPDQNGVDLLPRLRAAHAGELPVVMLTGTGDERVAVASLQRGAQHYLSKQALNADALRQAVELAIERAAEAQSLRHRSFHDSVTGLANRHLFEDRIAQTARTAERTGDHAAFALLYMDLDRFKSVNDQHGHAAGDHVLRTVAERLGRSMRESDTLARLGGDEFAAILTTTSSLQGAVAVAEKLSAALRAPIPWEDALLDVGISIGIALFPHDATDVATLIQCADEAMYCAKRAGLGYAVHEAAGSVPDRVIAPAHTVAPPQHLTLVFQPKEQLSTGELRGVEMLIRWPHPALGQLPPRPFIPVAPNSDAARSLSYLVLEEAVSQAARWAHAGIAVPVAANLSPRLLADARFTENVAALLRRHGVTPSQLMLEIAETDLLRQSRAVLDALGRLATTGVQLAIDNFGSGCAPLHVLDNLPIAEVKIDRAFVQDLVLDPDDPSLIASVVRFAGERGANVVAEGVDSTTARSLLIEAGCDIGQGLLCAAPMLAEVVLDAPAPAEGYGG